jgi:hypothetical protein
MFNVKGSKLKAQGSRLKAKKWPSFRPRTKPVSGLMRDKLRRGIQKVFPFEILSSVFVIRYYVVEYNISRQFKQGMFCKIK